MPKFILILPDVDILRCIKMKESKETTKKITISSLEIGSAIHYIIKKINFYIDRRTQDLRNKKPGATFDDEGLPNVIWIWMVKRPIHLSQNESSLFSLRGKFNSILEERIKDSANDRHRIMSIEVRMDEFDRQGNLASAGKADFWREVDQAMSKFDNKKISLLPRPGLNSGNTSSNSRSAAFERVTATSTACGKERNLKLKTPPPAPMQQQEARKRKSSSPRRNKHKHNHTISRSRSKSKDRYSHHKSRYDSHYHSTSRSHRRHRHRSRTPKHRSNKYY